MKKFTVKATALAIASVCGSAAFAGSITAPVTPTAFAVEALKADGTTPVTLPNFTYAMGVGRPTGNGFTIIVNPSSGSTFPTSGTICVVPTYTGAATVSTTVKRQSTGECAYDVQVNAGAVAVADTFTWTGQTFATTPLASGSGVSVNVTLKDPGESAYIDQVGAVTGSLATSGRALTLTAAADTATVANVNDAAGPLFGFVVSGDDLQYTAKAAFTVGNNSGATTYKLPNGTTNWDFTLHGTSIAVTVAGNFQGLATTAGAYAATTTIGTAPTATATAAGTTATFTLLPANFAVAPSNATVTNSFTVTGTASLGTARTFGVSAVGTSATAGAATDALAGSTSWWTWGANASQLMVPYLSTNSKYVTRFSLLNTGAAAVGYSVTCYAEGTNVATNGANGTLKAAGTTIVDATAACSFADATKPRGAVIFTINGPINTVKGAYNIVDATTGANGFLPMVRPYNALNTTE